LSPLGAEKLYRLDDISKFYGLSSIQPLEERFKKMIDPIRFNLILHPKSKGSAREWGLDNFGELIRLLPKDKFKIFISGTNEDQKFLLSLLETYKNDITDITGLMSLTKFISFINEIDGIIAASTGPLHIAAALGKVAIGLYAPMRPIHPGRWSPVGLKTTYLVLDKNCNKCRHSNNCECIQSIKPEEVFKKLNSFILSNLISSNISASSL
jgi:heptosyltransferase III